MLRAMRLKFFGRCTIAGDVADPDIKLLEKRYPRSYSIPSKYKGEEIVCSKCGTQCTFSASDKKEYYENKGGSIYAKIHMCPKCHAHNRS